MKITIIGSGPAGYELAAKAVKYDLDITLITEGPLGGTCLNEGCIPTKTLCKNAEVLDTLAKADVFGIENLQYNFDFSKVHSRKNEVIDTLRSGIDFLLKNDKIEIIYGRAELKDKNTLTVKTAEGESKEITSDYIIVATGSYSVTLPIMGNDLEGVIDSTDILSLPEIPKRLCVIGAGVIGLEFASIFKSFGSEVTVLEYFKEVLPRFDKDLTKRFKQSLSKRDININTGVEVKEISALSSELEVKYLKSGKQESICADKVLMAVGRRPNVENIGLNNVGITYTPRGIEVNDNMQTNIDNIYAVGDVVGGYMLAHVATAQGFIALDHILEREGLLEQKEDIRLDIVPAAVFTNPELATVGMTQEQCKEQNLPIKVLKSNFKANGKALSLDEPEGYCKIIIAAEDIYFDKDKEVEVNGMHGGQALSRPIDYDNINQQSEDGQIKYKKGQILGCHLFGAHASDIIQEITALMNLNETSDKLSAIIHAHPTLSEVVHSCTH